MAQTQVAAFWDDRYSGSDYSRDEDSSVLAAALDHFGAVSGKRLLEIGCGPGASSVFFGRLGANVTGLDVSPKAIADFNVRCSELGLSNVRGVCANALEMSVPEPMDFVFGSMILHHIEPFSAFAERLVQLLKPGGRAFFYENNASSSVLIWFRQNVVGKLWVPKHGDPDEFPLMPSEIEELRKRFKVRVVYPEMFFFELVGHYLFRGHLIAPFRWLDHLFYRRGWLLKYSYRQFVLLEAT